MRQRFRQRKTKRDQQRVECAFYTNRINYVADDETQNVYDIIHDSHLIYTFFAFPLKCLITYEMALCLSLKCCKWMPTSM